MQINANPKSTIQRSAPAAAARTGSTPGARRPSSTNVQRRREASTASAPSGSRGSAPWADSSFSLQAPWLFDLPDAIGLLVQQPLLQLRAELRVEDDDTDSARNPGSSNLSCLSIFLRRMLQALLELQQLVDSSRSGPHGHGVSAMMQWLGRTREELCLWGQRAGRALRALAGSNEKLQEPKEFGNQLHSLLEGSFMEALKHTSSRFDEELSQLREELQQTRSEATAAATEAQKQEAIAAAKEAAQWRASFEQLLHKKFEDSQAADELHWHNLREEIIRSKDYVFSELAEQHKHSVKNLSELWSSQNLQRERELHLLREQAENALMEMKSSIGSAQLASSKAESEQRALSASEQREKGALSLLLAEAMDAVSTRDRSVDHLRRSLGEEHARPEPVQAAMTLSQCQTPSILGSAGPIPPSPKPSAMDTANIGSPGKYAERTIRVMQAGSYEDSSASVCRLSTESTPYGAKHLPEALSRRTVMETSQSEKAGLQSQVAQGAGVPPRPAVDTQSCMSGQRPFRIDKVPQSVSLRRQSQASATSKRRTRVEAGHRGASTTDRDAKPGLSPSASTDTLRITASWD